MENFNQGLLGLVTALRHGMDPQTAYGIFGNMQDAQAQAVAARQQRLSDLANTLTQAAQSGIDSAGAQAIVGAQPGGPKFQAAAQQQIASLYPDSQSPTMYSAGGPAPTAPQQTPAGQPTPALDQYGAPVPQPSISPVYAPSPDVAAQDQLGQVANIIQAAVAKNIPMDQIKAALMQDPTTRGIFVAHYADLTKVFPQLDPTALATGAAAAQIG